MSSHADHTLDIPATKDRAGKTEIMSEKGSFSQKGKDKESKRKRQGNYSKRKGQEKYEERTRKVRRKDERN